MSIFQQTLEQSDERFLRDVGISKATFQQLLDKVATYLRVLISPIIEIVSSDV